MLDPNHPVSPAPPAVEVSDAHRPRFEEIYARERHYLWRTLRRLGIPERHLEDVAHDVLIVVHKRLDDYRPERPLRPWLFGIAMRVASDFRRTGKNARETPRADLELADESPGAHADAALEGAQRRALVYRALDTLDDDRRAVFVLHEIDGEAVPVIAEALGIPANTAYSRLRVAREQFAASVRRLGGAR